MKYNNFAIHPICNLSLEIVTFAAYCQPAP
jgi:hypothetical protein